MLVYVRYGPVFHPFIYTHQTTHIRDNETTAATKTRVNAYQLNLVTSTVTRRVHYNISLLSSSSSLFPSLSSSFSLAAPPPSLSPFSLPLSAPPAVEILRASDTRPLATLGPVPLVLSHSAKECIVQFKLHTQCEVRISSMALCWLIRGTHTLQIKIIHTRMSTSTMVVAMFSCFLFPFQGCNGQFERLNPYRHDIPYTNIQYYNLQFRRIVRFIYSF